MIRWLCLFLTVGFAALACPAPPLTSVPLTVERGTLSVPVTSNGQPARLVLDTGAQRSVLAKAAMERLGVTLDGWVATTMSGVGGVERHRNAVPSAMTLDGVALARNTRGRDLSLAVARLAIGAFDGLLGRDLLAAFAFNLDLPARALRLHAPCPDPRPPYPARGLPVTNPADTALVLRARLDGVAVGALLDTGAAVFGADRAGNGAPRPDGGDPGRAREPGDRGDRPARRASLGASHPGAGNRFGPLGALYADGGADWLAGRRLWIAFPARQVWLAD